MTTVMASTAPPHAMAVLETESRDSPGSCSAAQMLKTAPSIIIRFRIIFPPVKFE
ncbi:hypothetical protein KW790_03150 [Candidatus Parcubacteria bacterium]|nr:hypothetical protein [Candidatus Parcubacteria bacterium]